MQKLEKILFITAFPPGIKTAGQNYTMLLLESLADKGCQIDVCFFRYGDHVYRPVHPGIRVIREYPLGPLRKIMNILKLPLLHPFFTSRLSIDLLRFVRRYGNDYDAVYLDFSQVFLYGKFIRSTSQFLMLHDIIYQKYMRSPGLVSRLIRPWVRVSEGWLLRGSQKSLLTFSEKDRELAGRLYGVEVKVVSPYLSPMIIGLREEELTDSDYFCFYGAWNRPENTYGLYWYCKNVHPYLPEPVPIKVIGGGMSPRDRAYFATITGIELLGFVKDPYPLIAGAKALIAPLFQGAGVKFKVLESLACGTSVIGTEIALEGIPPALDEGLTACNTSQEFISEIAKRASRADSLQKKRRLRNAAILAIDRNRFTEILR